MLNLRGLAGEEFAIAWASVPFGTDVGHPCRAIHCYQERGMTHFSENMALLEAIVLPG